MSYISDIAYGKRVKTPRIKRAERIQKAKKVASSIGKGISSFGKDIAFVGKAAYKDVKGSKKPIKLKKIKRRKISYPDYISGNYNFGKETLGF